MCLQQTSVTGQQLSEAAVTVVEIEFSSDSSSVILPGCVSTGASGQGNNVPSWGVEAAFGPSRLPPIVDITEIGRSLETPLYGIDEYKVALPLDYVLMI